MKLKLIGLIVGMMCWGNSVGYTQQYELAEHTAAAGDGSELSGGINPGSETPGAVVADLGDEDGGSQDTATGDDY